MKVLPANPYNAVLAGRDVLRGGDGRTVFKIYYVDILGRQDPSLVVWRESGLDKQAFLDALFATPGVEGIGFVAAFPHITKAFRFGPESEIVMNVKAWNTRTMVPIDLARGDGYVEFACYAEALLAADEYRFWAEAESVDEYLTQWSDCSRAPIECHAKLSTYWGS